jgi:predicted ester cyclase
MQTNEKLFRSIIMDGFSKGDSSVIDKYAAKNFIEHQYGMNLPGVLSPKAAIADLHRAFPDFSMKIEDIVATEDTVWGRMTARGTHKAQFGPMPATGKKFEITVIDIMRFKDGKLVEHWGVPDRLGLMEQLGMKAPPKLIMKLLSLKK